MSLFDLTLDGFLILREAFFEQNGVPRPFTLRAKLNTQDDPLDEYIASILSGKLSNAICLKSPGPLISPDMVLYRKSECDSASRQILKDDVTRIVGIEVKKLERSPSGQISRSTGLDYNTTPPCGIVRVYDANDQSIDIRGFYLFVCQETVQGGKQILSALTLCDGNALNADFTDPGVRN